ncbi:MAG: phage shock protein operon transcriptional activator [Kordiimonadales bacterium]|nr:MAG: phage shock protein operon transcriptional activator [Kordiimonadales bacterium]
MIATPQDQIIGSSTALLDMMDHVSRAAPLDRPMLVVGERGTGKEMIAARLHYLSKRWDSNFQKMNCAALTETLLESELFGYEPGAFTGARNRRAGRFEAAHNGSLFLDEIGTMSQSAQEKLLRIIEYGEFERVGGTDTITVDVRVIAATNIDLPAAANAGEFRHDLLDRLAFDVITVPPLRDRPEDIPILAEHFGIAMAGELEWLQFPGFTKNAMDSMLAHDWPGNIRELKNVVERAIYSAWDGEEPISTIIFDPFDSPYRPKAKTLTAATSSEDPALVIASATPAQRDHDETFCIRTDVDTYEARLLFDALERHKFNQRATASFLKLSYDQLRHAIKKHGISCS